jgi:hypothetical protein
MILCTTLGDVSVINEPTYTFGSSDNVRSYPFERNLDSESSPVSVHGIFLNEGPIAVFGATGGASGVHEHSAVFHNGCLYLAVSDSVVCLELQPFEFKWALRIDSATCFGVHFHERTSSLISHGELEITRFTESGEFVWQSSGRDIFTGSLVLGEESVPAAARLAVGQYSGTNKNSNSFGNEQFRCPDCNDQSTLRRNIADRH